ncbi:MAG: PfkB family carbohydrate kinase [Anaerolineae bacterium]
MSPAKMEHAHDVDVLMLGHFAKDRLVVDGVEETASGGAVYYGSIALRHLGISVAVVTRAHPDDFSLLEDMEQEGVKVYAVPASATSGIRNIYDSSDMERRICRLLSFAGAFREEDLPDISAQVYLITPIIAGEVDLALLKSMAARGPVGLDVQGFVRVPEDEEGEERELVFRQWPDMVEGLSHVTYLKVDRAEAELLTGKTTLKQAAEELASYGPREVVVTQSSGLIVYADGQLYQAPFTSRSLVGRTGRGDTAFSTYVGKRLEISPEEATRHAAAVTSLKQEKPGPWRGSSDDVQAALARSR